MEILAEKTFSTTLITDETELDPPKSQIRVNKQAISSFLDGAILECCIAFNDSYLVFMTDDIPYEDTLRIILLDANYSTLDYASLFWPYSTGSFQLNELIQPDMVSFQFFGGCEWRVNLYPEKKYFLSFLSEPGGVSRKFGLSHYFRISGNPLPESE